MLKDNAFLAVSAPCLTAILCLSAGTNFWESIVFVRYLHNEEYNERVKDRKPRDGFYGVKQGHSWLSKQQKDRLLSQPKQVGLMTNLISLVKFMRSQFPVCSVLQVSKINLPWKHTAPYLDQKLMYQLRALKSCLNGSLVTQDPPQFWASVILFCSPPSAAF